MFCYKWKFYTLIYNNIGKKVLELYYNNLKIKFGEIAQILKLIKKEILETNKKLNFLSTLNCTMLI